MRGKERLIALELLDQSDIWIDGRGVAHRIERMDLRHIENVRDYLLRAGGLLAETLYQRASRGPQPSGSVAIDGYETVLAGLEAACEDPGSWLEQTPLLEALNKRLTGISHKVASVREVSVVIRLKVSDGQSLNEVRHSLDRAMRNLEHEHEIEEIAEGR